MARFRVRSAAIAWLDSAMMTIPEVFSFLTRFPNLWSAQPRLRKIDSHIDLHSVSFVRLIIDISEAESIECDDAKTIHTRSR